MTKNNFKQNLNFTHFKDPMPRGLLCQITKIIDSGSQKRGYINLEFSKPEIKKDVIIEFTVQDNKTDRKEYDSIRDLRKAIRLTLANTNWRLMTGVYYKLGILEGRLRGYENEKIL